MAIIKQAKNIRLYVEKEHRSYVGKMDETSQKIFVYATKDDLLLGSNKKVIAHGNT